MLISCLGKSLIWENPNRGKPYVVAAVTSLMRLLDLT